METITAVAAMAMAVLAFIFAVRASRAASRAAAAASRAMEISSRLTASERLDSHPQEFSMSKHGSKAKPRKR